MPPRQNAAAASRSALLPFASLLASQSNGPELTCSQLEDTLAKLTQHDNAATLKEDQLFVDLVALFGLALRRSAPAPGPPARSGPGPSTSSAPQVPYVTDEARQLYRRIRIRLSKLLLQDILGSRWYENRLRTLLLDLLLRTHVLRCYSSLLGSYAQLLRARPSRRNQEGAHEVVQEVQHLLQATMNAEVSWSPTPPVTDGQRRSGALEDGPHPNIPYRLKCGYNHHLNKELAESQLPEAWAVCFLQLAACQTISQVDELTPRVLALLGVRRRDGPSTDTLCATPALQALLSLVVVRGLAAVDGGSSYGQAAAAAAAGSEDGDCGPPWTLVRPSAGQIADVSTVLRNGGDLALSVWERMLGLRLGADAAAATLCDNVVGPAAAAGVAEDWARGPGSLSRPGLDQLRAQEAEVKRLEAVRREVYRSLQAADQTQEQQQQAGGAGPSGQRQQRGAGARPAQGQDRGRGGTAGKTRQGQARGQELGPPEGDAGSSSTTSSQAPPLTPEHRAELELQAAALTAQLRQARGLPAVVPMPETDTKEQLRMGYTRVTLRGAQHALHTGDPALRYGPPGYRVHFTTFALVLEAFVEEAPGLGDDCYMRPYVVARSMAAQLRARGVVLPAGLEELIEEAPEAIHADDVSWMDSLLGRTCRETAPPQPLPAQLALPPWNDAAAFDVCIRLANAARAEWMQWAAWQSPTSLLTRDKYPPDAVRKAKAACRAFDCALTAARLLARSTPPTAQAGRRAAVRRLRQLWRCYCAALEAALGLVLPEGSGERAPAAAQRVRLPPDADKGAVWGWHDALADSPDMFRLLPEEGGRESAGPAASAAGGAGTGSGAGGANNRPGPEAAALLSAGYLRLWTLWERASLVARFKLSLRRIGRARCWAEVLAFGQSDDLLDLLAAAAVRAREAAVAGQEYVSKLREAAAASELPDYNQGLWELRLQSQHQSAVYPLHAAARLLWTLHAVAPLFAAGGIAGGADGGGSGGMAQAPAAAPGEAQQPHLQQLGLMWSVVAEHILPRVAEGLICTSAYPEPSWSTRAGRTYHTAATALMCCRLVLNALHRAEAGAAAARTGGEGGSSEGSGPGSSSSRPPGTSTCDDAALWRRLLLCDVDVLALLAAAAAAITRHVRQPVDDREGKAQCSYGGGGGEDEADIDIQRACAELHSTAVLAAAVLPRECVRAAQQGASGCAGPGGAQQPGQYRVPLAVESIAGLFGPDGPCPNPQWQADVRQAFASANAVVAATGSRGELSEEELQAFSSGAQAVLQQQREAQQMQAASALLVPPGRVRSALRQRYPGRRLWLCDNPACEPAVELDASGWPLFPQSCVGAGAWVWCGGCESSLYCSEGCRLAHWQAGHGAVCGFCRGAAGQGV